MVVDVIRQVARGKLGKHLDISSGFVMHAVVQLRQKKL